MTIGDSGRRHGWLLLDKPPGPTSARCAAAIRHALGGGRRRGVGRLRVGHAGALDPFASGMLPIGVGEAVKTMPWVVGCDKTYLFTMQWGRRTDTDDPTGVAVAQSPVRPSRDAVAATLASFVGVVDQTPPAFSARRIAGRRAYEIARRGETPKLEARPVAVRELRLVERLDRDHDRLFLRCGSGFYVRALARDLAHALGSEAHLVELHRLAVGRRRPDSMIRLDRLFDLRHTQPCREHRERIDAGLHPLAMMLDDLSSFVLNDGEAEALRCGRSLAPEPSRRHLPTDRDLLALAVDEDGRRHPVAVVAWRNGVVAPRRVFRFNPSP